jgi:glycosyltransferase involved in cell wall biosynthesis
MLGERESYPNSRNISNPFIIPKEVPGEYPPLVEGNYQVALVGRLEMFHKGHDLLIQVLGQPKWKERPVTFNVYGTGPHLELFKRLLVAYGVDNVVIQGFVSGISAVWKSNHLLILPSRMEGQSLALLEAMWCNRGALVTNVGGAAELVIDGETGFMSDFPTVPQLDTALEKAWSMREDWEQIGINAGKKIRDIYGGDPMKEFAEELEGVFRNINT